MSSPSKKLNSTWSSLYDFVGPLGDPVLSSVRLVRERATGSLAALKQVSLQDVDLVRQEVAAIECLAHPGIVQLIGHDLSAATPWVATAYVPGGNLEERWLRDTDEPWVSRVKFIRELLAPLALVHGNGIVHRDLKPRNIAIDAAGQPVLLDFGLAGRFASRDSREQLEVGGYAQGTLDYMAPEQIRGEYVDARSDVYSLGCLLFRAITGQPPFSGTVSEVVDGHFYREAPSVESMTGDCPELLSKLVARMLSKDPRPRPGFVSDVADTVDAALGLEALPVEVQSYLYRPAFVGRSATIASLLHRIETATLGQGGMAMLVGESGSGKTRLAMELTRISMERGLSVLIGECQPVDTVRSSQARGGGFHPFRPFLRAVAADCVSRGPEFAHRVLGTRLATLERFEPTLREVPRTRKNSEEVILTPDAARARAIGDMRETILAYGRERPTLLVLDDLQWADDMTVSLLRSMPAGSLKGIQVLIVGTYRTDEAPEEIRTLVPEANLHRVGRLSEPEVRLLIGEMLASDHPPTDLTHSLASVGGGNPFFIAEYLRAAVAAGSLERDQAGRWQRSAEPIPVAQETPISLQELISRRISVLTDDSRRFLSAGAVFGRSFESKQVAQAAGLDVEQTRFAISELTRRDVCEYDARGRLRFFHDKLREVAYDQLDSTDRTHLHEMAASLLVAEHQGQPDYASHYSDIARHWRRADRLNEAREFSGLAGEFALGEGSHFVAHEFFVDALEIDRFLGRTSGALKRAQWLRMASIAAFGISDLENSIRDASEAVSELGERVPKTVAGNVLVATSEVLKQVIRLPRVQQRFDQDTDRRARILEVGLASDQLATSFYYDANMFSVIANLFRALNRKERVGEAEVPDMLSRVGFVLGALGLPSVAASFFERSKVAASAGGRVWERGNGLYIEGQYHLGRADWHRVETLTQEASESMRAIGDIHEAEVAETIGAHGQCYQGDFDEAERRASRIRDGAESRGHDQHIAWGRAFVARSRLRRGEVLGTSDELEECAARVDRLPDVVSIVICHGLLANACMLEGRVDQAVESARHVLEVLESGRRPAVGQCVDGYWGVADALVSASELDPDDSDLLADATRACRELNRFSRTFPVAGSPAANCLGRLRWLQGRHREAVEGLGSAIEIADSARLPYDAAVAAFHRDRLKIVTGEYGYLSPGFRERFEAVGAQSMPDVLTSLYHWTGRV